MKSLIKQLLRENLLIESDGDTDWDLYDLMSEYENEVIGNFINSIEKEKPSEDNPLKARQPWETIPLSTLTRQWEEYMRYGFVKPNYEITILKIEKLFTENILKVRVNTILTGHSTEDPKNVFKDNLSGSKYDDENLDKFVEYLEYWFGDYVTESHGQLRISDYGLPKLEKLLVQLRKTHDASKKLPILDKMLNVIHQRSDIAAWFVEGGSNSLSILSGEIE